MFKYVKNLALLPKELSNGNPITLYFPESNNIVSLMKAYEKAEVTAAEYARLIKLFNKPILIIIYFELDLVNYLEWK